MTFESVTVGLVGLGLGLGQYFRICSVRVRRTVGLNTRVTTPRHFAALSIEFLHHFARNHRRIVSTLPFSIFSSPTLYVSVNIEPIEVA